jgi:hypothetical protein
MCGGMVWSAPENMQNIVTPFKSMFVVYVMSSLLMHCVVLFVSKNVILFGQKIYLPFLSISDYVVRQRGVLLFRNRTQMVQ